MFPINHPNSLRKTCLPTAFALAAALLLCFSSCRSGSVREAFPVPPGSGVVIEHLKSGGGAERAGLFAGDLLVSWERAARPPANPESAWGALGSPFDVDLLEMEQAPRGAVTLLVYRGRRRHFVSLQERDWGLLVRPHFKAETLKVYLKAQKRVAEGKAARAFPLWQGLAEHAAREGAYQRAMWLYMKMARADFPDSQADYEQRALVFIDRVGCALAALIHECRGDGLKSRRLYAEAETVYQQALTLRNRCEAADLGRAMSHRNLGNLAFGRGDYQGAGRHWKLARDIRQNQAPGSLALGKMFHNLALLSELEGSLNQAETDYLRALALKEKLSPGSRSLANTLASLGNLARARGRFEKAEKFHLRALEIYRALNLAPMELAKSYADLGNVHNDRKNFVTAEHYYRLAHDIFLEVDPTGNAMMVLINNLGTLAVERGRLDEARDFFRKAVDAAEKLPGKEVILARRLNNLANLEKESGSYPRALELLERAALIFEDRAPGSTHQSFNLRLQGEVLRRMGKPLVALKRLERFLDIVSVMNPFAYDTAVVLHEMAGIYLELGEADRAETFFERALVVLETQLKNLGGGEGVKAGFSTAFLDYYKDLLALHIERDDRLAAFRQLERARAPIFRRMLFMRDLVLTKDIPARLLQRQRQVRTQLDRLQAQLEQPELQTDPSEDGKSGRQRLRGEIEALHEQRANLQREVVGLSPRLAALKNLDFLDFRAVQEVLDPGTLFLAFSVHKNQCYLFAVSREMELPRIVTLNIDGEALAHRVEIFREFIGKRRSGKSQSAALRARAEDLFQLLLAPVTPLIQNAERLLISPDGPLHLLPFSALVCESEQGSDRDIPYLISWKPIHTVLSATVYGELKKSRKSSNRSQGSVAISAFADPHFNSKTYQALPATRLEVQEIKSLYGADSEIYLGERATEQRAKTLDRGRNIVHFATHGVLNEDFPLESALVLSGQGEGEDNGLLQTWEIMEQVRIDADLVVLSGCETALGKNMGGEGLIGLTRAFQFSGARTILASLWRVSDTSTALLMKKFYEGLKAGLSKDRALQQAQLALIRSGDLGGSYAQPYFWAAFELIGDWL